MRAQPRSPVTVCAVDTANPILALRALDLTLQQFAAADALLLTHEPGRWHLPGCRIERIAPLATPDELSLRLWAELRERIRTPHVLLVAWDAYVIDPSAWTDAFLDCDYLGAPWPEEVGPLRVGAGGFSLRSRRLLDALAEPPCTPAHPEDIAIGRTLRPALEARGLRFGSVELAERFAVEAAPAALPTFGFQGLANAWRAVPAAELPEFVATLAAGQVRLPQFLALGRNYLALGRRAEARVALERRLAVVPDDREAAALLSQARSGGGAFGPGAAGGGFAPAAATGSFAPAATSGGFAPRAGWPAAPDPDALLRAALAAHERGDLAAAESQYRAVLALQPQLAVAGHYLGVLLLQRGDVAAAAPLIERSAQLLAHVPDVQNNLGLLRRAQDRLPEALAAYARALARAPDHAQAWNNVALDALSLGRTAQAVEAGRRAVALLPDFAEAHWNLGLALLHAGQWREGFAEYEWRWRCRSFAHTVDPALAGVPRWDGGPLAGRTLALVDEQGYGDNLKFVRLAAALAAQGARVVARVRGPLVRLFARAAGVAAAQELGAPLTERIDLQLPMLSAAQRLGVTAETVPAEVPYLSADPAEAAAWRARLGAERRLRVGLVWAGSPTNAEGRRRTLALAALAPLLAVEGAAFYSLQVGAAAESELAGIPQVVPLGPELRDFAATAAAIEALDLVISIDTAVAHLAGALGRPVWVLLVHGPGWHWLDGRADSPWYPTLRVFQQPARDAWDPAIGAAAAALRERVGAAPAAIG